MRILIAGAGVGGLAAALSLHAAGFSDVRVLEAAPQISPIGVGLNLLPNAVRELDELGLLKPIAARAVATRELRLVSRHGAVVWTEPRGIAAGYGWPQLSVHRGHLQAVLAQAVRERLGQAALTTGARVVGCRAPDGEQTHVAVRYTASERPPGISADEVIAAEVVIGADGIRSAVRASFYPAEGPPPGNGIRMWRGTSWAGPFLDGATMVVAGTDTERLVLYPIARHADDARVLVNWVAACPAADGEPRGPEDEQARVPVSQVLERFGDWAFDWLDIPAIIAAGDAAYAYPMVDRDPLPRWTFGGATLLGDAAHAMYPMGSNGATQAIIDARALASALSGPADPRHALARYESQRRPLMTRLQESSRRHGPEAVLAMVHQRAPHGFDRLHDVISERELAEVAAAYSAAAGLSLNQVNRAPSGTGGRSPEPARSSQSVGRQ